MADDREIIIALDPRKAQHTIDTLNNAISELGRRCKQPKYTIEFDNIHDIHVYVDGKEVVVNKLFIDWATDTERATAKHFRIDTVNEEKGSIETAEQHYM